MNKKSGHVLIDILISLNIINVIVLLNYDTFKNISQIEEHINMIKKEIIDLYE